MNFDKKKYNTAEVKSIVEENSAEYEKRLSAQRARINELIAENKGLKTELGYYKNKEDSIVSVLLEAKERAKEERRVLDAEYALEVETLRKFSERWKGYFKNLAEKYPLYPAVKTASALAEKLELLLKTGDNRAVIKGFCAEMEKTADEKVKIFNPKQKINEYIAATADNGFNLEEVLNPGTLHLEDLCKELGLLEETEL